MREKKHRLMSEINVVPYIDVMLVLLIIFMITAPLLTQGITVELPDAPAQVLEGNTTDYVVLSVDREGKFYLNFGENQDSPVDDQTVLERVSAVLRNNEQAQVVVKGDENVPYGRIITGASLLSRAGAKNLGFLTDPVAIEERR
jgi:biopolymer transport protein TolR